jgi:hypothetical protein
MMAGANSEFLKNSLSIFRKIVTLNSATQPRSKMQRRLGAIDFDSGWLVKK